MKEICKEALHYYLSYKHVPSPLTIWKGVLKRPLLDLKHLKWAPTVDWSEEKIIDHLNMLLIKSIKRRLSGKFGIFLSGGIDSGIIAAIASKLSSRPIHTFCLVYDSESETEGKRADREYARLISELYRTKHVELSISFKDFPKDLPNILSIIGEPFSGYVSEWFISKLSKPHIDIALTGDWADELFGSYKVHRLAYLYPNEEPWKLKYQTLVFKDEEKKDLYSPEVYCVTKNYSTLRHLKGYSEGLTAEDPLNRMLEFEFRSYFPDHTYMSLMKLSKAWGLEVQAPWSDPLVIDFVTKIPGELKIKGGETKYIEKQLAIKYLPEEIVYRKKEGFVTPTLPLVVKLEEYVRSKLSCKNLAKHGLFNSEYIQKLLDEFYKSPTEDMAYKIWNILSFQIWYEVQGK